MNSGIAQLYSFRSFIGLTVETCFYSITFYHGIPIFISSSEKMSFTIYLFPPPTHLHSQSLLWVGQGKTLRARFSLTLHYSSCGLCALNSLVFRSMQYFFFVLAVCLPLKHLCTNDEGVSLFFPFSFSRQERPC